MEARVWTRTVQGTCDLILCSKHEREHTHRAFRVAGIFRTVPQTPVIVVYLPKELASYQVEAPEIVFPAITDFLGGKWPAAAEKVKIT